MKKGYLLAGCALLAASSVSAQVAMPESNVRDGLPIALTAKTKTMKSHLKTASAETLPLSTRMKAEATDAEWTNIGTGTFTEGLISSMFEMPAEELTVEFEQNVADPTTYRIVNPYANWEIPYEDITYNPEAAEYMTIHVINNKYVYIDDFNTGLEMVDEGELPEGDDWYLKVVSQAQGLIDGNGLDVVVNYLPGVFGTYENGVITFPPTFALNGKTYSSYLVAWGDTSEGYYIANKNGDFKIKLPGAVEKQPTTWEFYGTANFTDDMICSIFNNIESETMEVVVEVDADDPNHFRIQEPYANWSYTLPRNGHGEFEYYVCDNSYVYFTKMNSGVSYNGIELNGEMTIADLITEYGVEAVLEVYPDAFCTYEDGVIKMPAFFVDGDDQYYVLVVNYNGTTYGANRNGLFCIAPVVDTPDDPYTWNALGTGSFTDDFLASYLPDVEISTFPVEIEQDADDANHYRIVNPYANWNNPNYSVSVPGIAEFYVYNDAYAYFTKFSTGVAYEGQILQVSQNICNALANGLTLENAVTLFPESLCKYDDGVMTATATFDNGGSPFSVFQIPVGDFLHRVNLQGAFCLLFPNKVGVDKLDSESNNGTVYYNLQGARVMNPESGLYIRVSGNKSEKVMIK